MEKKLRALFIILFTYLFSTAFAEKILYQDRVLFKVNKKTVFLTDFKIYMKEYELFKCLQENSQVLKVLKLNDHLTLPKLLFKKKNSLPEIEKKHIQKLIKLIKLQVFSSRYKATLGADFLKALPQKKCQAPPFSDWGQELKSLFQMELYVLERFPQGKGRAPKELELFLQSVDKKIEHTSYF